MEKKRRYLAGPCAIGYHVCIARAFVFLRSDALSVALG